jgi:hypothetical protein
MDCIQLVTISEIRGSLFLDESMGDGSMGFNCIQLGIISEN